MGKMIRFAVLGFASLTMAACGSSSSGGSPQNTVTPPAPAPVSAQDAIRGHFQTLEGGPGARYNPVERDPSGTLWIDGVVTSFTPKSIQKICRADLGLTVPTVAELTQLARYMGREAAYGFHPEFSPWPINEHTLLIGSDSMQMDGSLIGIDGKDGNTEDLVTGYDPSSKGIGDQTGWPSSDPGDQDNPGQQNFSTICIYKNN